MADRPILFQGAMVRALLAGTKTQTRRAWRIQPPPGVGVCYVPGETKTPYGHAGDRLWVRETWAKWGRDDQCGEGPATNHEPIYRADGHPWDAHDTWRPSIYMPRAASRITLEVTGVRVERLQDISQADAVAEGVNVHPDHHGKPRTSIYSPVQAYRDLWESINGTGSWEANPWVWAIEFTRIKP